jgi:peptide/nickel transport system permease protein
MRKNPVLFVAVIVFVGFVLVGALAHALTPHALESMNLRGRLLAPGADSEHLLGTDQLGRDVLTRVLFGIRSSLLVAGVSVLLAASAGVGLGILAGFAGNWFDVVVMRVADLQLAVPAFFFALAASVILGPGLQNMIIVLAVTGWASFARVARASTLAVKEEPYVEAARSLGAGALRIGGAHVFPNILGPSLVILSVKIPSTIMIEASLSFLGLGLPPGVPSLGTMINAGYSHMLSGSWWISIIPGIVLMLLVMSINTIADSLRDVADVRIRQ